MSQRRCPWAGGRFAESALSGDALLLRLADGRSVFDSSCETDIMTVEELMREALRLDPPTRATMAHELLKSLESLSCSEVQQLWVDEAVLRSGSSMREPRPPSLRKRPGRARLPSCDEPPYPAP